MPSTEFFLEDAIKHWCTHTEGAADTQFNVKATEAEHQVLSPKFLQCNCLKLSARRKLELQKCAHVKPLAAAVAQSFGAQDALQPQTLNDE